MDIEHIRMKRNTLAARHNDTKEEIYEFEFWDGLYTLLDCINTFDTGIRRIDNEGDIKELTQRLKSAHDLYEGNIKYLKGRI